jgi:hypothetical protein
MDRAGWSYPSGRMRVSDADRDRALSELSQAFQAGRLTADEFGQRSGQALRARTGAELTALLADLPAEREPERAPAPGGTGTEQARRRLFANRVSFTASIAATCFALAAAVNGLNHGLTPQQRYLVWQTAVRGGVRIQWRVPPSPGFDWAGTIIPAAIAVLLVAVMICLRVRVARAGRR